MGTKFYFSSHSLEVTKVTFRVRLRLLRPAYFFLAEFFSPEHSGLAYYSKTFVLSTRHSGNYLCGRSVIQYFQVSLLSVWNFSNQFVGFPLHSVQYGNWIEIQLLLPDDSILKELLDSFLPMIEWTLTFQLVLFKLRLFQCAIPRDEPRFTSCN